MERRRTVANRNTLGVRPGGGGENIKNTVGKVGSGETKIRLIVATEPRPGEIPVLGWNIATS